MQDFKEKFCKINCNGVLVGAHSSDTTTASTKSEPCFNEINDILSNELFACGESLFKSIRKYYIFIVHHILFFMILDIHEMVVQAIGACSIDTQSGVIENVVLCGGKFCHVIYEK